MLEFAADNAVLVEIKIAPQYDKRDEAQLLNVLKATGLTTNGSSSESVSICGWNNN